ncbi:precorrin-3B synthase [Mesorhizobium sp. ASY16-5R]|uniref:precorrin-3B synthase n=1 Tax=Mesorhizobium sp. ASY16-5R TaxID=3445772 RepID=UPI003F9EBD8F
MNAPLRRGACPALSAPMPTGDGLLIRLSPVSGGFSPKQLIGLCESAARHGNGIVEVTARGSCQFRGFSAMSANRFAGDVDALAIDVRTGVPVEISPLAGMDPSEIGDAAGLAERIRQGILAAGLEGRLGPKVSMVVDGGGQVSLDSVAADVRLAAGRRDGTVLWCLAIAGDAETSTQLSWYDDAGAVQGAISVLGRIAEGGREARARDFFETDWTNLLALRRPSSPCRDLLPANNGEKVAGRNDATSPFSPSFTGRRCRQADEGRLGSIRTALLSLVGNQYALPIALSFGHIDAAVLIDLVRTAEALGITDFRPAPHRCLLPVCPSLEAAQALREHAQKLGFVTDPSDIRKTIAACPGAPACASGTIAARTIAEEVARTLGTHDAHNLSIHISGCEKGCARQAPTDITIIGGEKGAGLVVHGTTRTRPLAYRSAGGLPEAIAAVAAKLDAAQPSDSAKAAGRTTKTLSPAQLACLKAAFEQDGP